MKQGTQSWCSATTQREGGGEGGRKGVQDWEGAHAYLWLIHADIWQNPSQYCKVIIL